MPPEENSSPDSLDLRRLDEEVAGLAEDDYHRLRDLVERGRVAADTAQAFLAVGVARQAKREALRELPIYFLLIVSVSVAYGLIVEDSIGLFVYGLVLGVVVAIGGFWWPGTYRPLAVSERHNMQLLRSGHAPPGADRDRRKGYGDWLIAVVGARLAVTYLGFSALALLGSLLGRSLQPPEWLGAAAFLVTTLAFKRALSASRRRGLREH